MRLAWWPFSPHSWDRHCSFLFLSGRGRNPDGLLAPRDDVLRLWCRFSLFTFQSEESAESWDDVWFQHELEEIICQMARWFRSGSTLLLGMGAMFITFRRARLIGRAASCFNGRITGSVSDRETRPSHQSEAEFAPCQPPFKVSLSGLDGRQCSCRSRTAGGTG